jgi:hypothetical protein
MRIIFVAAVVACTACGVGGNKNWQSTSQALSCDQGQTEVFTNRFTPQSGGSGVATGADAAAGKVNSDGSSGGAPPSGGGGAPPPSTPPSPPADPNQPLTAMVVACGDSQCPPGLVEIDFPQVSSSGGVSTGAVGASSTIDGPATPPSPPANPPPPPPPTVKCAPPPPSCAPGFSPQYTGHDTWECTNCALVVTYGGIYGNYRRCVNAPDIACPGGQVPTWSADNEDWECKPTCDNGMYDQHTIEGQLVCVPC